MLLNADQFEQAYSHCEFDLTPVAKRRERDQYMVLLGCRLETYSRERIPLELVVVGEVLATEYEVEHLTTLSENPLVEVTSPPQINQLYNRSFVSLVEVWRVKAVRAIATAKGKRGVTSYWIPFLLLKERIPLDKQYSLISPLF